MTKFLDMTVVIAVATLSSDMYSTVSLRVFFFMLQHTLWPFLAYRAVAKTIILDVTEWSSHKARTTTSTGPNR